MPKIQITKAVAVKALKGVLPLAERAMQYVQLSDGRTHMPPMLRNRLRAIGIERWAEFYLDESKVLIFSLLGIYSLQQLEDIGRMLGSSDEAAQQKFWNDLIEYMSTDSWIDLAVAEMLDGMTAEEMKFEFEEAMKAADEGLRREVGLAMQASFLSMITSFYNGIAIMAYGQPLTHLVRKAAEGDLNAYFKAYHVDETIAELPVFTALHDRKRDELKGSFFNALSERRRKPVLPGQIKYPQLWFTFAFLEALGALPSKQGSGLSLRELMELCIELKIYGHDDVKWTDDLSKRLQDYRGRLLTKI